MSLMGDPVERSVFYILQSHPPELSDRGILFLVLGDEEERRGGGVRSEHCGIPTSTSNCHGLLEPSELRGSKKSLRQPDQELLEARLVPFL